MIRKEQPSLLEQLSKAINIDADTLDVAFVSSLPIQVHDVTSNQRFVQEALEAEVNKELVAKTVKEMKGQPWEEVYAVCVSMRRIELTAARSLWQKHAAAYLGTPLGTDLCASRI
jgi:hypothetical protein